MYQCKRENQDNAFSNEETWDEYKGKALLHMVKGEKTLWMKMPSGGIKNLHDMFYIPRH